MQQLSNKSPHLNKNSLQAIQMHQQQKMQLQTQYHPHGLTGGIIALSGTGGQNFLQKGVLKKKLGTKQSLASPHTKQNGMLATLHPSGTIQVTGVNNAGNSSTVSVGMMSTDFKSTMKHNSSNNSIHSHGAKKQMITTIRKPTDHGNNGKIVKAANGSYMSPYSQKMAAKAPNQ